MRIVQGDCHDAALRRSHFLEPRYGVASRMCRASGEHYGASPGGGARLSGAVVRSGNRSIARHWAACTTSGTWTVSSGLPRGEGATSSGIPWRAGTRFKWRCPPPGPSWMRRRRVVRGEDSQALCLVRPPGHHAVERSAMGFCLFNNVAIAARMATADLELDRVLIVDWDVHHCNGTQATFWEDEQVGVFSIHRSAVLPRHGGRG